MELDLRYLTGWDIYRFTVHRLNWREREIECIESTYVLT